MFWQRILYVVIAVAGIYFIRIRRKLKKHGRYKAFAGSAAMSAGNLALAASVIIWLGSYVIYSTGSGGIGFAAGAVIGIMQMICTALCAFSAVSSIV